MESLLIKQALYKGEYYTPEEWSNHPEQLCKSKKKDEIKLQCPDGCELRFRRGHVRNGVCVQPHFFHKCQDKKASCLYMKKYFKGGGESTEHMLAKYMIAGMDVSFERICKHAPCLNSVIVKPESSWTSDTEVRINNKWLADVIYYGLDKEIKCVIEVKHKHAVDGAKRQWLLNQPFEFIEVSTNEDVSKTKYQIIDMKDDYYCMNSEMNECHTHKKKLDNYFVQWMLGQDVTQSFWDLYQKWGCDDCREGFDGSWECFEGRYGYYFSCMDKDDSLKIKFNSFPSLVQARQRAIQNKIEFKKCVQDMKTRRRNFIVEWKYSEINKYLNAIEPRFISKSREVKGINLLLVAYIYPHQINWILGYGNVTITWRKWIDKHKEIYNFCYDLTSGRKIKCKVDRRKYTATIEGLSHPFSREVISRIKKSIASNLGKYLNTKSIYDSKRNDVDVCNL